MEEKIKKLEEFRQRYYNPYSFTSFSKDSSLAEIKKEFSPQRAVSTAGRLISLREHGKSAFFDIADATGKIQCYIKYNLAGQEQFELFSQLDLGDIVGVEGNLFLTHSGEKTILTKKITLLSKCLHTLPEKWHGLKDVELRYRERYLDLIANVQSTEIFSKRVEIVKRIREFFEEEGFLEVETPMLHSLAGGATGRPFVTHHNALNIDLYLRIAPELYLKRILVGGFDRIYEINRSFRNEGISVKHNPEFTMLEAYACYQDYTYMMKLTQDLICRLAEAMYGSLEIEYGGKRIDFKPPWRRISLANLLKEEFGLGYSVTEEEFVKKMSQEIEVKEGLSRSQIINLIEDLIESRFFGEQPVFVTDFYTWMSPLAKRKKEEPNLVERFELFCAGMELANAYSELNDPQEQRKRFLEKAESDEYSEGKIDYDFLKALEYAMPPAAGLGIGIDRLCMVLLNQPSIKDVIFFPLLKPKNET